MTETSLSAGLPHSGISGSTPADGSPKLFAAFHALHRLMTPRHPPCAFPSSALALTHDAKPTGSTHSSPLFYLSKYRTNHDDPRTAEDLRSSAHSTPSHDAQTGSRRCTSPLSSQPPSSNACLTMANKNGPTVIGPCTTPSWCRSSRTSLRLPLQFVPRTDRRISVSRTCPIAGRPTSIPDAALAEQRCSSLLLPVPPADCSGGDGRIRTPDLPRARRALSH